MIFSGTLSSIGDFFCIEKPSHIRSVKLHLALRWVQFLLLSTAKTQSKMPQKHKVKLLNPK